MILFGLIVNLRVDEGKNEGWKRKREGVGGRVERGRMRVVEGKKGGEEIDNGWKVRAKNKCGGKEKMKEDANRGKNREEINKARRKDGRRKEGRKEKEY